MLIKLKWVNNNDASAVVQVFRSTAAIDTANPGAALATLPGNATSYDDTTVDPSVKYYYAVSVSKGAKKLWTPVKTFVNESRRGPGSNRILIGDERLGYYGKLTTDDFLDLGRVLGLPSNISAACRNLVWHKFIRKGKIIFVADRPLLTAGTTDRIWTQQVRRSVGYVSGMAWNFDTTGWAETKRTLIAEKNGDRFHFRALRGLPDDWNGSVPTAAMVENPETEFNELLQPLMNGEAYFPNKIGCLRVGTVTTAFLTPIECAERIGTGHLVRLMQPAALPNATWVQSLNTYNRTKESFCGFMNRAESASEPSYDPRYWDTTWPAFELID